MDHRAVILLKSGSMQRKARMELWLKFHPLHHMLPGSPTFQVLLDSYRQLYILFWKTFFIIHRNSCCALCFGCWCICAVY